MFNPHPIIQVFPISEKQSCYVIDDFLADPSACVELAVMHRSDFREAASNAYPGIELPMSQEINQALINFFSTYINRRFGVRKIKGSYSRLSLVTKKPEQLRPCQWICHRDGVSVPEDERMLASVLYLFQDASLGGTSIYRPKADQKLTASLIHDANTMAPNAFSDKYGITPGFMTESNDWFEKVISIGARWNRMVIYDSMVFHSGDILRPEAMTADPKTGRLSLNGFYRGRRSLV
jgi:hypothetical protein